MEKNILSYFKSEYKKAGFRVVPGDWPDFKTKSEVDAWLKDTESELKILIDCTKSKRCNGS